MAARGGGRQSSFNAGELDPQLAGRVDIKQYYSGGLRCLNVEPVPQSGFRQMPGTLDIGPVRGRIATFAAGDATPTLGPHTGLETIWTGTLDQPLAAVRLTSIGANTGTHTATVEALVGATWVQIGQPVSIGQPTRTRVFSAPPGQPLAATQLRVRVDFSVSATASLSAVTPITESDTLLDVPRYAHLRHDSGDRYFLSLQRQFLDIWLDDAWVAGVYLDRVGAATFASVDFYAENATIGVFHRDIAPLRIRRAGSASEWEVDDWPLEQVPTADLGATYSKTDDVWEIFLRWTDATTDNLYLSLTVEGATTPAIVLKDAMDAPVGVDGTPDWAVFASEIEDALEALASLGPGVTVAQDDLAGPAHRLTITFGGALAGAEYDVNAAVTNTANIAALPVHVAIGETEFEPLFSSTRGWPGVTGLVQDRLAYGDIKAEPSAIAFSQPAEYFRFAIEIASASAGRLDRLRAGQTAERVLAFKESTYFLAFTDVAVHFAANRTISGSEPLNWTITSETGIVANTEPVELEGKIYFVASGPAAAGASGHQIMSLGYDELISRFSADPESLLASHLIVGVTRAKRQRSSADTDAARMWLMRADGLLVAAQVIRSQEIMAYCRWAAAQGGLVREIEVDARNQTRICVSRGGRLRHERMDPALFLHAVVASTSDMVGRVAGLELHEGRTVWAVAGGRVHGPLTVLGGAVTLDGPYAGQVLVGLWQPPLFETMPRWLIRPNDEIVKRPGRIHTTYVEVIDTTSIAVGANGQPARDVALARLGDPAEGPTPAATRKLTVAGMQGVRDGTTLVITQTRPGRLRVRDLVIEEKL